MLELKAAYLGLKSLCRDLKETHIKILTDNTTAVHGINNMDSCKSVLCDAEVRKIWDWATERNNFLTATWPSQFWYPALFAILENLVCLNTLPNQPDTTHPLFRHLEPMACKVCGKYSNNETYQKM